MTGDAPIREILIEIQDLQNERARWKEILNQSQPNTQHKTVQSCPIFVIRVPRHLISNSFTAAVMEI